MADVESENELSLEITPTKNKISMTTECIEPSSTSTLPAMTQDFVKYGEADYGVDLTTLFHQSSSTNQCTQTPYTPTVTSPDAMSTNFFDSSIRKKKKPRSNSQTVENEVNGIFDLLNSSDEMSQNEILTQPIHNADSEKSASKRTSKHGSNKKKLDHLVSGLKYRKRRRQRQQLQLKTSEQKKVNNLTSTSSNRRNVKKDDIPRRQRLRLTSYFQINNKNKANNDMNHSYESSITSEKNRSSNLHNNTSNNYDNDNDSRQLHKYNQNFNENDHDGIFGSILNSIHKEIQEETTSSFGKSLAPITPFHPCIVNNDSTNIKSSNASQTDASLTAQEKSKDSTNHTTISNIKSLTKNKLTEINPANITCSLPSQMYSPTLCKESIADCSQNNESKKEALTNGIKSLNKSQQFTVNQTPLPINIDHINRSTPIHKNDHTSKLSMPLTDQSCKNPKRHPNINTSPVNNESKDVNKCDTSKINERFDEIEFDEKALLIMDNLVESGKTPKVNNQALRLSNSIENNISSDTTIKRDSNLLNTIASNSQQKPMGLNKNTETFVSNRNKEDDDSFGSIPDIDFEEMDKLIAQRTSLSSTTETSSIVDNRYVYPPCPKLPICNKRIIQENNDNMKTNLEHVTFSRYIVVDVIDDNNTYTKTLVVSQTFTIDDEASPRKSMEYSSIHLRGEWYRLTIQAGNIVHLVSISGNWKTDFSALPITLHTLYPLGSVEDDLVLVLNPHMLMTPSITSEAVECPRRAVIKSRIGSSGLSSYAAVIGTMRHELFEKCLQESNFSSEIARLHAKTIVRKHADLLLGCEKYDDKEACAHLLRIIPEIQRFAKTYINFGQQNQSSGSLLQGNGFQHDIWLRADSLQATEESVIAPELGLKGNIDATLRVTTGSSQLKSQTDSSSFTSQAILGVELKTGHNQNTQNAHLAQLALYSIMLRVCHGSYMKNQTYDANEIGALHGGMLLYLNHESHRASYTSSTVGETKSLIIHRNLLTVDIIKSAKPRGIIQYEENIQERSGQTIKNDKESR